MRTVPRVAHVVISLQHGGLEQCALQWCHARNQLHPGSTAIVCLSEPGPLSETIHDVSVFSLGANRSQFPWDRSAVARLREIIAASDIEILHSHNTAARQYASLARQHGHPKHIYTDHGTNIHLNGIVNRLRLAFMKRQTDAVVAVSRKAATVLASASRIPRDMVQIIRNGVSVETKDRSSRKSIRERWNIPEEAFVIGYVGRLSREKGVDRLVRAFAELASDEPDREPRARLLIIGDGPIREELTSLTEELGLTQHVHFAGAQPNARTLMCAFDLFTLPSRSEGLPLALLEAMAESIPVATTRVGECTNVLEEGRLGVLLPDDDSEWPDSLDQTIAAIKDGASEAMVSQAYQSVKQSYSIANTISEYEQLYRQA